MTEPNEATPPASASAPERKWKRARFNYNSISPGDSIEYLERMCKEAREAMATGEWRNISVDNYYEDYSVDLHVGFFGERPETDSEQIRRLNEEAKWKADQEKRDQAEFNRLKQKFQDGK